MIIILSVFLAGSPVLPQIDRTALDLQARAEALQPRARARARPAPARATRPARPRTAAALPPKPTDARVAARRPVQTVQATTRRPAVRRATAGAPLDLAQITTICRAAGNQEDPAGFIARLSSAYSLSGDDSVSLRSSCAAYLAGRADARRTEVR